MVLKSGQSLFLRGPRGSGKNSLAQHLRNYSEREGCLLQLGPNPSRGLSELIFSMMSNCRRKGRVLESKNPNGLLLMIEDVSLNSDSPREKSIIEFLRQLEKNGQFYLKSRKEVLLTEGFKAVLTSHNNCEPGSLSKDIFIFQMEQMDLRHLESIFLFQTENLLSQRTTFKKKFCDRLSKDLVKVIRNIPHFFEKHLPQTDDRLLEHLDKLMDLESSLWNIHNDYLQEPANVVGAYQSEIIRIWSLNLANQSLRVDFQNDLLSKMKGSIQSNLFHESKSLGAVTSLQIPGKTNYLQQKSMFCKKLVEDIEEMGVFSNLMLTPEFLDDIVDLSRFLDMNQPLWIQGSPMSGKQTILDVSSHLLNFQIMNLKVSHIEQNSVLLAPKESSAANFGVRPSVIENLEDENKGISNLHQIAVKWLKTANQSNTQSKTYSESFSKTLGKNGEVFRPEKLRNPLLQKLKNLLINSFFLAINQSKKSILLITDDLFEFSSRRCVDEVMAVLQSLVTPFEMISCFSKAEIKKIIRETKKMNRKRIHNQKFKDYFR